MFIMPTAVSRMTGAIPGPGMRASIRAGESSSAALAPTAANGHGADLASPERAAWPAAGHATAADGQAAPAMLPMVSTCAGVGPQLAAATFAAICAGFVTPAMTLATCGWAASQPMARSSSV